MACTGAGAQCQETRYLQAAAECLELARATQDERTREGMVALAQKWLDLAYHRSDKSSLLTMLEAFNDWQMKKRSLYSNGLTAGGSRQNP